MCSSRWRTVYKTHTGQHFLKFISAGGKSAYLHCYAGKVFDVCSHKEEYSPESGFERNPLLFTYMIKNPKSPKTHSKKKMKIVVNNWKWRKTKPCADGSTWNLFHALKYLGFKMTHKTEKLSISMWKCSVLQFKSSIIQAQQAPAHSSDALKNVSFSLVNNNLWNKAGMQNMGGRQQMPIFGAPRCFKIVFRFCIQRSLKSQQIKVLQTRKKKSLQN